MTAHRNEGPLEYFLIDKEKSPKHIVCDDNIFYHAVFRQNPWNEPDQSSFYCIQILSKNKITLLVNDNIIRHYSKTFNKITKEIRERRESNSIYTSILSIIKNYFTQNKKYIDISEKKSSIPKPDIIKEDDEDFFYLTIISDSELIVNDSDLREGVLESSGKAYFSFEFVKNNFPDLIIFEKTHSVHLEWSILEYKLR
jgi:hypothetical protein